MRIGIIGATGAVGKEMLQVLFDRKFPVSELILFASARSAGKNQETPFGAKIIEEFSLEKVKDLDLVLMAVSGDFAKKYAPQIAAEKPLVIDNSSAFRYNDKIPLVVPEINPEDAQGHQLIANPNCTTAILSVVLAPLHRAFTVKKCLVSTYQATSGGGQPAMEELLSESKNFLEGKQVSHEKFVHPIPFNIIPHIDTFQENAYTKEEMKVVWETQKILHDSDMAISCTAVRTPTLRAHAESIVIETEKNITPEAARKILSASEGVELCDERENELYPMPLTATKKNEVEVGRIRQSLVFGEKGLEFFICGDQLLKGAALNAVQIAELFL